MSSRALVTGGAGFIGHHLVAHLVESTDWQITCLDRLDCSGNLNRLHELGLPKGRVRVVYHDLRAPINTQLARQIGEQDQVFHLAASTHVDRSIADPMMFVMDNVVGTTNLLDWARVACPKRLYYFSSDEVFGPARNGVRFKEWDRYKCGNPYSASKAGGEEMCLAYHNTYGVPVVITHCMNAFGERQHPEKFIPMVIRCALNGHRVQIHADPDTGRAGSRFYIHARHIADAALFLSREATPGEKYNIVGSQEIDNLTLARGIAEIVGKPLHYELTNYAQSRPGHDPRYDLDGSVLRAMGWRQPQEFWQALERTVKWTLANPQWL